jgi:hypothetical protein
MDQQLEDFFSETIEVLEKSIFALPLSADINE